MWGSFAYSHLRYMEVDLTDGRLQVLIYWPTSVTLMPLFGYTLERYWTISCSDSGHEYQINTQHLSSHRLWPPLSKNLKKKPPFSLLHWQRSMWWVRQASSHQRNVGMLPRFLPHSRSLLRVGFGECGNRAASPQTAIVLASLSSSALFSASQAGERLRYNACPTPSQLSCHWLHMKKNETSSETRLQKKRGWVQCKKKMF